MNSLKVSTGNPKALITDIKLKIDECRIRSWTYEDEIFFHKGRQYIDHIYFECKLDAKKGIIEFVLNSDGNKFAESRAFQLLERMLLSHFSNSIELINN